MSFAFLHISVWGFLCVIIDNSVIAEFNVIVDENVTAEFVTD
jgi:hypothetical protein